MSVENAMLLASTQKASRDPFHRNLVNARNKIGNAMLDMIELIILVGTAYHKQVFKSTTTTHLTHARTIMQSHKDTGKLLETDVKEE